MIEIKSCQVVQASGLYKIGELSKANCILFIKCRNGTWQHKKYHQWEDFDFNLVRVLGKLSYL